MAKKYIYRKILNKRVGRFVEYEGGAMTLLAF